MIMSLGQVSAETLQEFLSLVQSSEHPPLSMNVSLNFHNDAMKDEIVMDAFHRLSTCMDGCGCTGYSPRDECLDPKCYCNEVTK